MEGLTNSQNVAAYSKLAFYYDYLLGDLDAYNYWLKYIEAEPFDSVLELASGSGMMASILESKGYDMIASDLSKEMMEASRDKYHGDYQIINMIDYKLDRKFDLVLCICDSINYLNEDDLDKFFKCAYDHLNDGGRLIFDSHHLERLNEFMDGYVEEGQLPDGNFYQWTINSDKFDNSIFEHFTFYIKNDMIQERHTQHVFDYKMLENKMIECGFKVNIIEDFIQDEKILVVGRK